MENLEVSKTKKKPEEQNLKKKVALSAEQYQQQIENLVVNNEALLKALDVSHTTIERQNKIISNLKMTFISKFPKMIELRLDAMWKMIQQLSVMLEETRTLLNDSSSNDLTLSLNSSNCDVTSKNIGRESTSAHKKSDSAAKAACNILEVASNVKSSSSNRSFEKSTKKSSHSKSKSISPKPLPSSSEFDKTQAEVQKSNGPSFLHDELMSLPASTSKARPKLASRKRPTSKLSYNIKSRFERSKKFVETYISTSDDDEPLINKRRRITVKLQAPPISARNKAARGEAAVKQTKNDKTTQNMNINSDKSAIQVIEPSSNSTSKCDLVTTEKSNSNAISRRKSAEVKVRSSKKKDTTTSKYKSKHSKAKNGQESDIQIVENGDIVANERIFSTGLANLNKQDSENLDIDIESDVKTCHSRSSSISSQYTKAEIIKNQPQVRLTNIFNSTKAKSDPVVKKIVEAFQVSSKRDKNTEMAVVVQPANAVVAVNGFSSIKLTDASEEIIPLDLELECIDEGEVMVSQNHVNEDLILEKRDSGNVLTSGSITSSPPHLNHFEKEISIDTIHNMLTQLCDEHGSKNGRNDDRLVSTYS